MPQILLDDLQLNYYDNGNVGKPALIFLHGLSQNLTMWNNQCIEFDLKYHVIAMDLRGHGFTSSGNVYPSMARYAQDIINLLNFLHIKVAHFVGLSLGGMICQELTRQHQNCIHSMTLCNTTAYLTDFTQLIIPEGLQTYINNVNQPDMVIDFREIMGRITVPTLIIAGEYDMITPLLYVKIYT